jgi:hypothetical protein
MSMLVCWCKQYPSAPVCGHRDSQIQAVALYARCAFSRTYKLCMFNSISARLSGQAWCLPCATLFLASRTPCVQFVLTL